jgi:hypothetical protein
VAVRLGVLAGAEDAGAFDPLGEPDEMGAPQAAKIKLSTNGTINGRRADTYDAFMVPSLADSPAALRSERRQQMELLHPVCTGVADKDVAVSVENQARGESELAIRGTRRAEAR